MKGERRTDARKKVTKNLALPPRRPPAPPPQPHLIDQKDLRREECARLDAGQCAGERARGDEALDLGVREVFLQVVQLAKCPRG